jgi:hypothetical protein
LGEVSVMDPSGGRRSRVARASYAAATAALVFPLAASAPAFASTVRSEDIGSGSRAIYYQADPGDANRLSMSQTAPGAPVTIVDAGADIRPGPGCSGGGHQATCEGGELPRISIELANRSDSLSIEPFIPAGQVSAAGGAGADALVVRGALGDVELFGEHGHDRLFAFSGCCGATAIGGPGRDSVATGANQVGFTDGGRGRDTVVADSDALAPPRAAPATTR